jgi:serine phosphatase RsbU (regulator of sigma subunit)
VKLATAGHPAPLLIGTDGSRPLPVEPQLMLGVEADAAYPTETYDLPAGASLLLYTDGVVECLAADAGASGDDR